MITLDKVSMKEIETLMKTKIRHYSSYDDSKEQRKESIRERKLKKSLKSRFKNKRFQESLKAIRIDWESDNCPDIKSVSYQHLRISNF